MTLNKKSSVVIGATSLVQPLTGIGQYTYHLSRALAINSNLDLSFFSGLGFTEHPEPISIPKIGTIKNIIKKILPNAYEARRRVQQLAFDNVVKKGNYDLYHEPAFIPLQFEGPTVITVHDLSYIRYPETHPKDRIRVLDKFLPHAIENSGGIIADSHFTKSEIIKEFSVSPNKIKVTHLGKSDNFYPRQQNQAKEILEGYGLAYHQYFLTVGTLEPRKNLAQAIEAYRKLPVNFATKFPLAVVGMRGWKDEKIMAGLNELLASKRAVLLGYVPDSHLPVLYSGARALIFPSIYEGFGLPVLEAMACGTPVIATNASSVPEVLGNAGFKVEIGDIDIIVEYLKLLAEDEVELSRQSHLGLERAKLFSWEKCALETYESYLFAMRGSN